MKILAGRFACGKTQRLLHLIEAASARGPIRLLVPTATLAERMQGACTLSSFAAECVPEVLVPSAAAIDREIREALDSLDAPSFRHVRHYEGFRRRLRSFLDEVSAPGVSAAEFETAIANMPYATAAQRAIARIYGRVEHRLAARNRALPGRRIRLAVERIRDRGAPPAAYFLDGFFSLSAAELDLVEALAGNASVTLTVPEEWPGAVHTMNRLKERAEVERLPDRVAPLHIEKFSAAGREQEVAEIARRIAEQLNRGEPAHGLGVIVRQEAPYVPILRATFARYGIPAAFYFAEPLDRQSPARFCAAVIESLLDGWSLERLREAIVLPASGFGGTPDGDCLDFEMCARIPSRGFEGLELLESRFGAFTGWAEALRTPMTWATALTGLVGMAFERAVIEPSTPDAAHLWRRRAAAIRAWKQAVSETASSMPDREIPLARFWNEAAAAIRATVIRCVDPRRECVAVVDAMEARQWRFRAAFVCGMIEGEFPRHPAGDAFFDNAARQDLARLGIPLRSSEEDEAEEQALIAVAASRAEHVILSWPAFTPTGEDSLPAFAIETFPGDPVAAPLSRVEPVRAFQPPSRYSIADPAEIGKILGGRKTWRPTEIECFLQCPFQYLGRYTLKLEPAPPEPLERFDARVQGSLVHLILRRLTENPSLDLEGVLDEELRALMRTAHIPASHATLWHRTAMLRVVRMFLETPVDRIDWNRAYEWGFEFDLVEGTRIKGRIDRFDSKNGAAFAIDYKYSKSERLKKSEAVQGGLYLLGLQAAGFRPQGFAFIALRDAEVVQYEPANLMATARERALEAVDAIVRGDIAVRPADPSLCRFCEFRPACRVAEMSGLAASAGDAE